MIYRNQTNTITQITNLSHIRITTVQEAVAFLRAIAPLNEQVAAVLQRASIYKQHSINQFRAAAPAPTPAPAPAVEPTKPFEPENLSTEEGYSNKEIEEKVAKLKKANKSNKADESSSKKKGN